MLAELYTEITLSKSNYLKSVLNKILKNITKENNLFTITDLLNGLNEEASSRTNPPEDLVVAISYLQELLDNDADAVVTMTEAEYTNAANIRNGWISVDRDIALHPDNIRQLLESYWFRWF